jgi:hypothetical protein
MPAIEEELRRAISYRNEMAVELAHDLLFVAGQSGDDEAHFFLRGRGIIGGRFDVLAADIEALTATILQRGGITWDAMAAPLELSKQALHRRLAARGEELFQEAVRARDRTTDPKVLIQALRVLKRERIATSKLPASLGFRSRDLIERLLSLPAPEEVLTAPSELAAALSELRQYPRWWWC